MAPKSPAVIECCYQIDAEWPDEMSPQRLEEYKAQVKEFREKLGANLYTLVKDMKAGNHGKDLVEEL